MPKGTADRVEVVVLATGPDALLAGHCTRIIAPFEPLEHALELHHSRVREEQSGVVCRDQRGAGHRMVFPGSEVAEKLLTD